MSQIAGLYVVPDSAVADIRKAALPRKAAWFNKPTDTFWQTLWTHAGHNRLREYGWSGYAFVVLFEYLRDRKHFDIAASENAELAIFLSKARQSYFLIFTPSQAEELAQKLEALPVDDDDVTQYVMDFCGPEEHETMVAAVVAAARILPRTLEGIHFGAIGVMSIG